MSDDEQDKLDVQILDALRGASDVERRLRIEMSTGVPSISDMAYAIKLRIKQDFKIANKVKQKRIEKNDDSYDVTRLRDIVGLRVVTLYRLDAIKIIPELLRKIFAGKADPNALFIPNKIEEIVIYSTNPEGDAQGLVSRLTTIFESFGLKDKVSVEQKRSNYSSIHMVVWCRGKYDAEYRLVPVEIQVRTALEDVWGEIDHGLKYKRKNEPEVLAEDMRLDGILAHINVMKTMIDGVAQYADQIKIQMDELDGAALRPTASKPAQSAIDLIKDLVDLPENIRSLILAAEEKQNEGLSRDATERSLALQSLQHARAALEEARIELFHHDEIPLNTKNVAEYVVEMELALTLLEIGKRVESGANLLGEAAKIYHRYEGKYPSRALVKYRHATALDALGDRGSAIAKFREVEKLIQQGNSELPDTHWIRSAAPRFLGTLIWEEANELSVQTEDTRSRKLELLLEAFTVTKSVDGMVVEARPGDRSSEGQKVANNALFYSLEFLELEGDEARLNIAGFQRADLERWLALIVPKQINATTDPAILDTARRTYRFLGKGKEELATAKQVLKVLAADPYDEMSRYHLEMRREAEASCARLTGRSRPKQGAASASRGKQNGKSKRATARRPGKRK